MAFVYLDRDEKDPAQIVCAWFAGASPKKQKRFAIREQAEAFALVRMGRTGSIVSTLDMDAAQLAAHSERNTRLAASMCALMTARCDCDKPAPPRGIICMGCGHGV